MGERQDDFFSTYADMARWETDAPAKFHQFAALTIGGAIIARNAWLPWGSADVFPNLWVLLIAPSSEFRKSTSVSIARRVLRAVDEHRVFPDDFTPEGLIGHFSQAEEGGHNNWGSKGCFFMSEFLAQLRGFERDYMRGTKEMLTNLYDCPDFYERKLSGQTSIKIRDAFVSLLAATTMEWFLQAVKEDDFRAGFYPRFMMIPCEKKDREMKVPPERDEHKRTRVSIAARRLGEFKGPKKLSPDALKLYEDLYDWLSASCKGMLTAPFAARMRMTVLKMALIYQADLDNSAAVVSEEAMRNALRMGRWVMDALAELEQSKLAFKPFDRYLARASELIQSGNGMGVHVRDIHRLLRDTRLTKSVLESLEAQGKIRVIVVKPKDGPGRPAQHVVWVRDGQPVLSLEGDSVPDRKTPA